MRRAVLLVCALAWPAASLPGEAAACPARAGGAAQAVAVVAEVADGGVLRLEDGRLVRLAQILVPKPAGPDAAPEAGRIAAAAREALADALAAAGGRVRLPDMSGRPDRHGRHAAQAVAADAAGTWLQGLLVDKGLARVSALPENPACIEDLLDREAAARTARRGLWATVIGEIGLADQPAALARHVGRFVIVEGRVRSVGERPRRTYLNFGTNWAEDFTVYVDGRDLERFRELGLAMSDLDGRRVRVRGWIRDDRGPAIRITHPGQLEIVGER